MHLGFIGAKKREKKRQKFLKEIRRCMVAYWQREDHSRVSLGITDIDFKNKDVLEIIVTLERPGLLIGKAGRDINALTESLKKCFNKEVKILIVEDKTWMNLWS